MDLSSFELFHVFRFVFAFLFFNQHNSLATLHAFSITMELGSLLSPQWPQQGRGSVPSTLPQTQPLSIGTGPCRGSRDWAPAALLPLLIALLFLSLWKRGFQNQFNFQKVYICGEGGSNLRERARVYMCKCGFFLSFFKNAVLFVSVCHESIAVSDFFQLYFSI